MKLLICINFFAQGFIHMSLQIVNICGQFSNLVKGQFAHGRSFKCFCGRDIGIIVYGVKAEQLARQIKANDLFFTVLIDELGFNRARPDSIQRSEFLAIFKYMFVPL